MASRGSFQKRQKEAARKEKRQQKLDRRQGRAPVGQILGHRSSSEDQEEEQTNDVETLPADAVTETDTPEHSKQESES